MAALVLLAFSAALPPDAALRAAEPNQLTPEQIADGWISLFDGETLFGWQPTSDANWKVEDGEIRVTKGAQGFLMTGVDFADYELHVEVQGHLGTNSGVFLRTPFEPKDPAKDCYELNVAPKENPFPTGSLVGRVKNPQVALSHMINAGYEVPADVFDVRVEGDTITIVMNGGEPLVYKDPNPVRRGRIALQFREGPVAFRNIRLKPLGLQPMLNGKDLTGWNTKNADASKFEILNPSGSLPLGGRAGEGGSAGEDADQTPAAELSVTNGRGILETDASYGDFVMQLEAFVDGDGLNSGVFFRSIPGEYANGYESQIHNGIKNNDPAQPTDFGTGAIYRRTPARRVVSKDHEWFTKTIVATGPHIAVWVNGYQVTDWTDERPPSDNPREGLRLAPGTISLQGHDPTTNLRFRNLRLVELPEDTD